MPKEMRIKLKEMRQTFRRTYIINNVNKKRMGSGYLYYSFEILLGLLLLPLIVGVKLCIAKWTTRDHECAQIKLMVTNLRNNLTTI